MALAASMTRSTSRWVTSPPLTAMTPWELKPWMWDPAMPAYTVRMSHPAISSASSRDFLMHWTVFSMLTTTPRRSPVDGAVPMPMMSTPVSEASPTTVQIFVVPTSRPTIKSFLAINSLLCCSLYCTVRYPLDGTRFFIHIFSPLAAMMAASLNSLRLSRSRQTTFSPLQLGLPMVGAQLDGQAVSARVAVQVDFHLVGAGQLDPGRLRLGERGLLFRHFPEDALEHGRAFVQPFLHAEHGAGWPPRPDAWVR